MPLERIDQGADYLKQTCTNREHNPPMHMSLRPGRYKWTCPACGKVTIFTVSGGIWAA